MITKLAAVITGTDGKLIGDAMAGEAAPGERFINGLMVNVSLVGDNDLLVTIDKHGDTYLRVTLDKRVGYHLFAAAALGFADGVIR